MIVEPLVGREAQLRQLAEFLDAIAAGPDTLAIEGEMGIGKTALFEAALAASSDRGLRLLTSRPSESEAQFAYAALGDVLAAVPDAALADLPSPQRRALEVALLRAEPDGREPLPRAVALGLLGVLRALARQRPALVAIDDAQWLDRPSASALDFALRRVGDAAIGLLVTLRSPAAPPLDLTRARRLELGSLDDRTIDRLVNARLDGRVPRRLLPPLRRRAGGNPLLALEIARAVLAREETGGEPSIPDSLRAVVRDRLAALPPDALAAVEATAALSRPTAALVEAVVPGGIDAGVRGGVLELDGERVRPDHPLLASVAYLQIAPARRRALHARLAELVTEPEERGRHLGLAAAEPGADVAAALDEAALRANARGAPDAAAELWEQARALSPAGDREGARDRGLHAAERHLESGDVRRALALLEELAADASPGRERMRVLARLGWVRAYADGFGAGEQVFRSALAEDAGDAALRVEVEQGLAWCVHSTASVRDAVTHARTAVALAETLDDPSRLAGALSQLALLESLLGNGLAIDTAERGVAVAPGEGMTPLRRAPEWIHAVLLQWADDLPAARERLAALHREAAERGDEHSLPFVLFQLARVELLMGDWELARRHAAECHETTVLSGQAGEHPYSLTIGALVDAHRGALEPAREKIAEGLSLAGRHGTQPAEFELLAARGFLALSLGEPAIADRTLSGLAERVREAGIGEPGVFRFHGDAIEAKVAAGRHDEAAVLLDELEAAGARLDRTWARAVACRCRALVSAASGDLAAGYEALEPAAELHDRLGQPFERARTELVRGSIQRRDRKKRAAREALEDALAMFERLGAELWAAKARSELARVGGRAPSQGLTPTEARVAELIAAGHTYQETADALFVSPKTVQWNLSKIYRKLGVRSRAELAARLGSKG